MLRKTVYFIVAMLLTLSMGGCAVKSKAYIGMDPFVPEPAAFQKSGKIYLAKITDNRKSKKVLGKIIKSGKVVTTIYTDQSMARWFENALTDDLHAVGCEVIHKKSKNPQIAIVRIRIDKLKALLNKSELTKKNLTATARVTLYIKQGRSKIVQHIGLTQSKWVPPFSGVDTIKSYLHDTLESVVRNVRKNIDINRF